MATCLRTDTKNIKKINWVTGSPPQFDTLLASWYPTYMQSFIISHSSCAEQYGDVFGRTKKSPFFLFNWFTGSPPKFDTLLVSWYPRYMQSFIISHPSCAEQYGNMSSDRLTHTHKKPLKIGLNLIGSLGHHQNLIPCWHHDTRHTCKVS